MKDEQLQLEKIQVITDPVLCTSVSEEGGDGHGTVSEVLSLSYTRRYVSFVYYEEIKRELNRRLYMSVGVMRDNVEREKNHKCV
jgi:hypothetical protein